VTFLFNDMEGSTRRWEEDPDAMGRAVAKHDEVVRGAIEANGGRGRAGPIGPAELDGVAVQAGS
jgi:class 3 adenylate cyclase